GAPVARPALRQRGAARAGHPPPSLAPAPPGVVWAPPHQFTRHFGITVICNLHSLDLARKYCDRLVGLAAGRLVFDGAPAALTDHVARDLYGLESNDMLGHGAPELAPAPGLALANP